MSTQAFFEREFPTTLAPANILASATVGGTFYAAVRNPETGQVWAFVAITQRRRDYLGFGYKDMDENMGPNEARAPARVLDKLTPLAECAHPPLAAGEFCGTCCARDWRQACRDYAAAVERAKAVQPGMALRFAEALDYGRYGVHQVLTYVKGTTFAGPGGLHYSVPGWQSRAWEPVPAS
jgi:hypothetical protein